MMVARRSEETAGIDPGVAAEAAMDIAATTTAGLIGGGSLAIDRLDYLADVILELQQMATDFGHERLARQLALAYTEAAQSRRRMQPTV